MNVIFVLFGATGDLAKKKIFPALWSLYDEEVVSNSSHIIAVSRRDWDTTQFLSHAGISDGDFSKIVSYSKVDIDKNEGYRELGHRIAELKKKSPDAEVFVYLSLAPRYQEEVITALAKEKIISGKKATLLIEKPFGTDEASAKALDKLLLSHMDEKKILRIDHYLGKDTIGALMDLHESTKNFSLMLSKESVKSIRIVFFENHGIDGRGASYDGVGAFRDVGQNHMLEMLAVLAAEHPEKDWQRARTAVLKHLAPPAKTCEMSHRGQYETYTEEVGVKPDSDTETAFEVTTSLSSGKLAGVPLILQSGKKMPSREVFIEILFHEIPGMPVRMVFNVQPEQEIVTEYSDGKRDVFEVPKINDAYANIIRAALRGSSREFVGSDEIEALWRYADHVVACWQKVPLKIYSEKKPFLIQ